MYIHTTKKAINSKEIEAIITDMEKYGWEVESKTDNTIEFRKFVADSPYPELNVEPPKHLDDLAVILGRKFGG